MKTILFIFLCFVSLNINAQSGFYDSIKIGFDPQNQLFTGYFKEWEVSDKNTTKKCEFYVKGTIEPEKEESILTIYSNDYQLLTYGFIKNSSLKANDGIIEFRLEKNIQQCQEIMPNLVGKEGLSFSKKWDNNWKEVRLIKAPKAYFYNSRNDTQPTKIYVIKGDFVGVIEKNSSWVKAEYITTKNKVISGWLRKSDLIAE